MFPANLSPTVLRKVPCISTKSCVRSSPAVSHSYSAMTSEERVQMEVLCAQIADEKDNRKFTELIQQLIDLLDRSRQAVKDGQDRTQLQAELPLKPPPPKSGLSD